MPRILPTLSRTSSVTSNESDDSCLMSATLSTNSARRARKRFTNQQLMMLEHLFHQTSHPTREDREHLAHASGMEIKSVTIWFQNKRQTERKTALRASTSLDSIPIHRRPFVRFNTVPHIPDIPFATSQIPLIAITTPPLSPKPKSTRPSLDSVASRFDAFYDPPTTPKSRKRRSSGGDATPLWDNMPSSPIAPEHSPGPRDYVEFGKLTRTQTLEWACARRRLAAKAGYMSEESEDESDVVLTPPATLRRMDNLGSRGHSAVKDLADIHSGSGSDLKWTVETGGRMTVLNQGVQDDDTLRAALALCGLATLS